MIQTQINAWLVSFLLFQQIFFPIVQNLTPQSLRITAARLSDSGRPGFDLNNDSRVDAPGWFVSSMDIFTDTAAILN